MEFTSIEPLAGIKRKNLIMDYFGNSRARYLKTLDAIPEDIAVNKAAKILDIGGYSVFEDMMIDRYGFENLKTFATPNLNVDTLDFENNSFDLIILGEVIEHLYDPDIILQECSRILKPNGVLLITTPNLLSWYNRILMVFGYYPMNLDISCVHKYKLLFPQNIEDSISSLFFPSKEGQLHRASE